jgi:exonuclease SbcC
MKKSSLIHEQNNISIAKDYMTQTNSMLSDYNEKFDSEIEKVKTFNLSMIEKMDKIKKDSKIEYFQESENNKKKFSEIVESIKELKNEINDKNSDLYNSNKINSNQIEMMSEKLEFQESSNKDIKNQLNEIYDLKEKIEKLNNLVSEQDINNKNTIKIVNEKVDTKINDSINSLNLVEDKIKKNNENLEFKVDKILRDYDLKNGIIDKLIDSKLSQYKSIKNEIKTEIESLFKEKAEKFINNEKVKNEDFLTTISNKVNIKIDVIKEDLINNQKDYILIQEGKLHSKIVEYEKRIYDYIDKLMQSQVVK